MLNVLNKLVLAFLLNIALFIVFTLVYLLLIKLKKADWLNAITFRQNFIAFSLSLYIFALLPVYVSVAVWIALFFVLREIVFKKDEARKFELFDKYNKKGSHGATRINKLSEFSKAFFLAESVETRHKDFKYSFLSYSNSGLVLILLWIFEVVKLTQTVNILFFAESLIIASVIFIFLGRMLYHIEYFKPGSVCSGNEIGTHIVVILFGIVYYFAVIAIMFLIHGAKLFAF